MENIINEFKEIAANPGNRMASYKKQGKKLIGVLPYYAPEELVYAAGMVPIGVWGTNDKNISRAKEYCATFYCSIAQLALEMLLDGTLNGLSGIITPTICDTLRPMSQNIRVAMGDKMPVIFLAHPQNRATASGLKFCVAQYTNIKCELEKISGKEITDADILKSIKVYNASRKARREFVKLASEHCDVIKPTVRSAVLKAAFFMLKDEYTVKLEELNQKLSALPICKWQGKKIVTSGIICDNPTLLEVLEENDIAIAADDVAYESRAFRIDAPEDLEPMMALAKQFANIDCDILLYDAESAKNNRADFVVKLVKDSGASGLILFMQQFCDPEEMEYPDLKKALDAAKIPHIKIGIDQQMRDFGQAKTAIQAFAESL